MKKKNISELSKVQGRGTTMQHHLAEEKHTEVRDPQTRSFLSFLSHTLLCVIPGTSISAVDPFPPLPQGWKVNRVCFKPPKLS